MRLPSRPLARRLPVQEFPSAMSAANISTRILVVDDELGIRTVVERVLRKEGFATMSASGGQEGFRMAVEQRPDLVILDLNLPDVSGEEVCKQIRQSAQTQAIPVLILSGRTAEGLPAECLEHGADDYVSKPFELREFVARVRALLRRPRMYAEPILQRGALTISLAEHRVTISGKPVPNLAPKEFELLRQIVLHAPQVVAKDILAFNVWGVPVEQLNPRTLDVHIRRIRQKLGSMAEHLRTVPAVGFQWTDDVSNR